MATAIRLSDDIEVLDLPPRAYSACQRNSIRTVGALLELTPEEFLGFRAVGQGTLDALQERLAAFGLSLGAPLASQGGSTDGAEDPLYVALRRLDGLCKPVDQPTVPTIDKTWHIYVHPSQLLGGSWTWGPRFNLPNGLSGSWAVRVQAYLVKEAELQAVRCINDARVEIYENLAQVLTNMVEGIAPWKIESKLDAYDAKYAAEYRPIAEKALRAEPPVAGGDWFAQMAELRDMAQEVLR